MHRKNNKEYLHHIVEVLIDYLRECDDGTDITTCQLLAAAGYDLDEFKDSDLFDIDFTLHKASRANHIILDMSAHDNMVEGLPFHLDFIVHNKGAQIKCPYCGSKSTARILYGLPAFSEELQKKTDSGKIFLGGCKIFEIPMDGEMVRINPTRFCNECKKEFGKPPLIMAKDWCSAEDYRDIVTALKFAEDSTHKGKTEITITKNEKGALVKVIKSPDTGNPPVTKQITVGKWKKLLDTLYSRMYLHEWKRNYGKSDVVDGTQWKLHVKLTGNRRRNYSGSNNYPPYWKELVKVFGEYSRI